MEVVFAKDPDALHHVQWEVLKALMKLALVVYDLVRILLSKPGITFIKIFLLWII